MIASSRNIRDFVAAVKDRDFADIILLAEAEATAAERMMYKHRSRSAPLPAPGTRYARDLKRLITYMRYGIKPSGISHHEVNLISDIRRADRFHRNLMAPSITEPAATPHPPIQT